MGFLQWNDQQYFFKIWCQISNWSVFTNIPKADLSVTFDKASVGIVFLMSSGDISCLNRNALCCYITIYNTSVWSHIVLLCHLRSTSYSIVTVLLFCWLYHLKSHSSFEEDQLAAGVWLLWCSYCWIWLLAHEHCNLIELALSPVCQPVALGWQPPPWLVILN